MTVVDQRDRVLSFLDTRDRRGVPVPAAPPQRDVPAAREGRRRRGAEGPRRAAASSPRARRSCPRPCSTPPAARATRRTSGWRRPGWRPTSAGGSRSTRTTAPPSRTSSPSATARAAGSRRPRWSRAGSPRCTRSISRSTELPDLIPTGVYAIPELAMVGRTEEELTDAAVPYVAGHRALERAGARRDVRRPRRHAQAARLARGPQRPRRPRARHERHRPRPHRPGRDGAPAPAAWTSS